MTDQPNDIDIEAERKDFEPFARNELGLSISRDDAPYGDDYWHEDAADAWATWKARASLAAEREREMVDLLLEAQREGCTRCYSDAVGLPCCYPHSAQCLRITAALKKGPSDDQRRA